MRQRTRLLSALAVAAIITAPLCAQSVPDTVVTLLQQSHDLNSLVASDARLADLTRQTELVSRFRPDLAREWANELFALSRQNKGGAGARAQSTALGVLSHLDPNNALALLDTADLTSDALSTDLTTRVFSAVVARDGLSALPLIEQAAATMGTKAHFPYAALAYAAMDCVNPFWSKDRPRAIDILRSVLDPSSARFSQSPPNFADDLAFGTMLQVFAGGLPFDLIQPALHKVVKKILSLPAQETDFHIEVFTRDGRKVAYSDTIDAILTYLGGLVNRDPALVQDLITSLPSLKDGLEATQEKNLQSMNFGRRFPVSRAPDFQRQMDALNLSHTNPEAASASADQLPAGQRENTLLEVARGAARDNPEKAAEIISSIQKTSDSTDSRMQLNLTSASASVAASQGNKEALHKLLDHGFELATQITGNTENHPTGYFTAGLPPMVQLGIKTDHELTLAFLRTLPPSQEKLELLLAAADALAAPQQPLHASSQ